LDELADFELGGADDDDETFGNRDMDTFGDVSLNNNDLNAFGDLNASNLPSFFTNAANNATEDNYALLDSMANITLDDTIAEELGKNMFLY
jgi:hypothetical protein